MKKICPALFLLLFAVALPGQDFGNGAPKPFAFVVIGDAGCGCTGQQEVAQRMLQWHKEKPFDVVLMLGDNIYGKGFLGRGGSSDLFGDRFDRYYKPLMDLGVKFYAVLGNHDMETRQGRDEIASQNRFHILSDKGYYSFTPDAKSGGRPLITFYALNSPEIEDLGSTGLEQTKWLSQTLSQDQSLWKVAYAHHPLYTPRGVHTNALEFRNAVEKIMVAGGVRIFFGGHNHFYARMKPQNGLLTFVSGGGGRNLEKPKMDALTVTAARQFHFLYLEVYPDNISFWAIPTSGPPIDKGAVARSVP